MHIPLVDPHRRGVVVFRWIVFLLAGGYCLYQFVIDADYGAAGGPFRFLTNWALLASFLSASRMLAISERRTERSWHGLVCVTAVMNGLTVLLYWRLWFQDPALVQSNGPIPWYLEYYLHLIGPLLQWIDALFIFGAFRRLAAPAAGLMVVILAYIGWIEMLVAPANAWPSGSVTSGLPYPFLNNLVWGDRVAFYGTTAATGFAMLALMAAVAWGVRRRYPSAARSAGNPSRNEG